MNLYGMVAMAGKKPVLIEITDDLRSVINAVAAYATTQGLLSQTYGGENSISFFAEYSVDIFAKAVKADLVDTAMVAKLEEYYRVHRSAESQNTNVYFTEHDMANIATIVTFLEKTDVRHLYHGKKVNKKLVIIFSFMYVYLLSQSSQ